MLALASPIVNLGALWKIILASLIGGAGVAVAFGLAVYGVSHGQRAGQEGEATSPVMHYALSAVAGAFCLAMVVAGIYAMTHK